MNNRKVVVGEPKGKSLPIDGFDHYVALDWSKKIMAIAHMGRSVESLRVFERPADIKELKAYLRSLTGLIVLTLEETTTAHLLYLALYDSVSRIIVCDPFHNRLLCHGPKTDKIDARKLCQLLRAGLLKEVFHTCDALYELRQLVSAYEDIVRAGVRAYNQQDALHRSHGTHATQSSIVMDSLTQSIALYEQTKVHYEQRFQTLARRVSGLKLLVTVPGIGTIGAVKILASVVDARRFPRAGHYLSYCGLVKHEKLSGRRSYGRRTGRFNHQLKAVYKIAALAVLRTQGPLRVYYDRLIAGGVAEYNARHALARTIARITYGILKSGQPFHAHRLTPQAGGDANT